jgi:hypothetical protein
MILGVLTVHDDVDVLEQTLAWHLNHGVTTLGIVQHQTTPEAQEILRRFESEIAVTLVVPTPSYFQKEWLADVRGQLTATLKLSPADWFIHFDADERWSGLDVLDSLPEQVWAAYTQNWANYLPHSLGEFCFDKITRQDLPDRPVMDYDPLTKVALRACQPVTTTQGNHSAYLSHNKPLPGHRKRRVEIHLDHFPIRTLAQWRRKTCQAENALQYRVDPEDRTGWHWASWLEQHKQDPQQALAQKFQRLLDLQAGRPLTPDEQTRVQNYGKTPAAR